MVIFSGVIFLRVLASAKNVTSTKASSIFVIANDAHAVPIVLPNCIIAAAFESRLAVDEKGCRGRGVGLGWLCVSQVWLCILDRDTVSFLLGQLCE